MPAACSAVCCQSLGCLAAASSRSLSALLERLTLLSGFSRDSPCPLPACPCLPGCLRGRERVSARVCVWFILQFGLRVRSRRDGLKHAQKLHTNAHTHTLTIAYALAPRTSCLMVKCKQPTAGCILAKPHTHTCPLHTPACMCIYKCINLHTAKKKEKGTVSKYINIYVCQYNLWLLCQTPPSLTHTLLAAVGSTHWATFNRILNASNTFSIALVVANFLPFCVLQRTSCLPNFLCSMEIF